MKKKKKAPAIKSKLSINKNIWPQERDIMFRPERFKYVRKLVKASGCVFCEAHKKGVSEESLCLYQNSHYMIVLNKYPYNTAHLMVLPVKHLADYTSLASELVSEMAMGLQKCMQVLNTVYAPNGFNVGMNHGAVAGAGIPEHLHWHVVPRWAGDTNFFPIIAETKVIPEDILETYRKLKGHF
jgi:ATP adenylyltransferase